MTDDQQTPAPLSAQSVAGRLNKSLRGYTHGGKLGGVKVGGSWIFTAEGLRDALQAQSETGSDVGRFGDGRWGSASRIVRDQGRGSELGRRRKGPVKESLESETDMAFLPLCNKYLDFVEPRMTAKTFDEKRSLCARLAKVWGAGRSVYSITPEMVMEYLSQQATARSNHASNRDRKNLLAMWNWGRKILGVNHNPLTGIDQLPRKRAIQYTPSQGDVLKVMAAATRTEGVFLSCYLQTGARRSEIFNLTWDDVNFEGRAITLSTRKTKGGEVRRDALPMSEKLYSELKGWYANRDRPFRDQPYVFVCDHPEPNYGQPFKVRRKFLSGLCKRAGVRPFGFHALRRFVASWL